MSTLRVLALCFWLLDAIAKADFIPAALPSELGAPAGSVFGYVTVPVRHAEPANSGTIRVAVLIVKAPAATRKPNPVLFFVGGPGGGSTGYSRFPLFTELAKERDVVLVDPRGTGRSLPNLYFRQRDPDPATEARLNRQLFRDRGIDVTAFNASEIAQDYESVRLALGYGEVNILANSFGTFETQEYLRRFPATMRSLVMTGNLAASNNIVATSLRTLSQGLGAFLRDVRRNRAARRDFPDFTRRFWSLVRDLNARPRHLALTDEDGPYERTVDGFAFLARARSMLIYTPDIPFLPLLVDSLDHHRRDAIVQHEFSRPGGDPRDDSDGEYNSVTATAYAAPGFQRVGRRALGQLSNRTLAATLGPDFLTGNRFLALWRVPFAPGTTRILPTGDVPTLLLNGEFDTQTPPGDGARIAAGLSRVTNYTYPRIGHGVGFFGGPDTNAAVAFIADPAHPPAFLTGNLLRRHFYRLSYP